MKRYEKLLILIGAIVLALMASSANASPPKVIKTVPENGQQDVDPTLKAIRIVFDQDMAMSGYSICGGGPMFPKTAGQLRWVNNKTLVMRVELEPNHEYQMSINCPGYQNCKNTRGEPAEIYPVNFKTATASSKDPNKSSQFPAVLLQKGLYAEQTEGDLDKAMEIYSRIREEYNDVERVSARATYQLGLCHLKKGDKETAVKYFEEVIGYFPEQKSVVQMAQQQLDKLGISSKPKFIQEMHNEIEPNGLIHFKMPKKIKNDGSEPITTNSFINSDFVSLTKMYDANGNAIPLETTHEGDIYRYKITFNKPIMPGDEFTYYSEGTITGLVNILPGTKDTWRYFMNHSPNADMPTLRIENYLLPKGAELISTTPPDMKISEKDGRVALSVEKVIPAGGSLTTSFQYKITGARLNVSPEQLEKIVKETVLTISTCAENDPKITASLNTLKALDPNKVVSETARYLDSGDATVRRSAIFILWRGEFTNIGPAEDKLLALCGHEENYTRGMAALALGSMKVPSSYETLKDITLNDKDGYARRCAAYALGLYGDKDALAVLGKALQDSDPMVKNNAHAAITMLTKLND
ncbi:MAG: HEAT repeat domain-containing protein, partial [Phycisphaerae bacterium]|nr:HEAT repeat domain-containing protein [Phycisphaerae bacterium]